MSEPIQNRQYQLAARPIGLPKSSDWHLATETLAALEDGQIRVKNIYLSLDPAMRGWMNDGKSYIRPVAINEVMRAGGIGKVVASKSPKFQVGDYVSASLGVQEYWQGAANDRLVGLSKVDKEIAALPKF